MRANLRAAYGLDLPLGTQYVRYLRRLVQGDFGPSLSVRDTQVSELIAAGLPLSVTLGGCALLLAALVGIPLGMSAAAARSDSHC